MHTPYPGALPEERRLIPLDYRFEVYRQNNPAFRADKGLDQGACLPEPAAILELHHARLF